MTWQTIDNVPQNTRVLLSRFVHGDLVWVASGIVNSTIVYADIDSRITVHSATHWMPLVEEPLGG